MQVIETGPSVATGLNEVSLLALIRHKIPAIRVRDFCDTTVIANVAPRLFIHSERGSLRHAPEFTRLGLAYSEIGDEEFRDAYHVNAVPFIRRLRDIFRPAISPIDELRLLLDETWPAGAQLLSVDRRKCFAGVTRYQTPGVDLKPHIDRLEWTLPRSTDGQLAAQLSVNIYLQVPKDGGELEIWDRVPGEEEYAALSSNRHYGIDREILPPPDHVIQPSVAEMIVINPRAIHAVRPAIDEPRITISAFVGFFGLERPLSIWS